jgi:enterochelin esterase-like enzyme
VWIAVCVLFVAAAARAATAPAQPAIAGIVAELARHPVVAIAEYHQLRQAGDLYVALVHDPSFMNSVDDIVVEFASGQSQGLLDRYVVRGDSIATDSLRTIWRDTSKAVSWDCPIYARWLAAIRDANRQRPPARRVRVLAGDTSVDWARLHAPQDWTALGSNDVSFARVIADSVLAKHHKALVVLGSNHLAHRGSIRDGTPNTTTRVEERFPGSMFVVLMWSGWPGGDTTESRIAKERWPLPALCPLAGHWAGDLLIASQAGVSRLGARADALLFLGNARALETVPPVHADLASYDADEVDRRSWIEWGDSTRARKFLGLGRVREYSIAQRGYPRARRVWVYTPPGYSAHDPVPSDLLLAFDGGEYLDAIPLPTILDTLIGAKRMRPTVALLFDDSSSTVRLDDLANHEDFVRFVGGELVPWARARWNVTHEARWSTITGSSAGGLASALIALRRPDLFGNVLSQSGAFWRGAEGSNGPPFEWVTAQAAATPKRDVRFFLDVGSLESHGAMNGTAPSILDANRRLRDTLRAKGYDVTYTEVPNGGHAPEFWRERLPTGLVTLMGVPATRTP